MASIARVPVEWSGLTALPGVSVFYWDFSAAADLSALNTFFTSLANRFPTGLTWTIPSSGDTIEDSTGALDGSWAATGGGTVAATGGSSSYAAGVGARIRWRTNGIFNGRRVVGSTFMAPLLGSAFDTNGTITAAVMTDLQSDADDLVTNGGLLIWSRPASGGGANGDSNSVFSAQAVDRVTALRSRRF